MTTSKNIELNKHIRNLHSVEASKKKGDGFESQNQPVMNNDLVKGEKCL